MFVVPETAAGIWPWTLTPLTARVIAGWFVLAGLLAVMYSTEARWQSWRILLQSQGLGIALILLGVARAWGELRTDQPVTWIFVIGLSLLLVTLVALYATMEARRPHPDAERLTAPDPAQAGS
jgi:Kef-type K+ transport system membrane component KefB